jgi:hydroxymethylglutaryl-CoA reductase
VPSSRISGFYKKTIQERLHLLKEKKIISTEDFRLFQNGNSIIRPEDSDKMIENVISVFGLPMGLGLNFLVNDKDYVVPMVVEEPSIVAAVSSAAKIARSTGGFVSEAQESILIGQIQVLDLKNLPQAKNAVLQNSEEIINLANSMHPNMVARGGGAREIEVRILPGASHRGDMLIVHLLVDTQDAMGANLVNSMCEGIAPLIEKITSGKVFLRILSNLADRSLVISTCEVETQLLEGKGFSGEEVRDGIILANEFALADPYRAATHNKGIMNGIDPVVIATGNDWRAIEAAAHAFAAQGGQYTALTIWDKNEKGNLIGKIKIPIRVGTVGGSLQSNPSVPIAYRILQIESAKELAELLGAVGLAQNMSALRALATEGIQRGHMSLHARSVAMAAGASSEIFEDVVEKLVDSSDIKIWKAKEIITDMKHKKNGAKKELVESIDEKIPAGNGKIILFGEHAVVYGSHAIAAPVPLAMQAKVSIPQKEGIHLLIPRWGVEEKIEKDVQHEFSIYQSLDLILNELNLHQTDMTIEVFPNVPRAMGLGGSASLAVAIIRALSDQFNLNLNNDEVNRIAFESEKIVHGEASGIDNTLATYGNFQLYKKGSPPLMEKIKIDKPLHVVVGLTWVQSLTAKMVKRVNDAWQRNKKLYNHIFKEIDILTLEAQKAIEQYDLKHLGELMNINHGLLNALQVSTKDLEELVEVARSNGALGAKLTGGGGGGVIIALCDENSEEVSQAIRNAGYQSFITEVK